MIIWYTKFKQLYFKNSNYLSIIVVNPYSFWILKHLRLNESICKNSFCSFFGKSWLNMDSYMTSDESITNHRKHNSPKTKIEFTISGHSCWNPVASDSNPVTAGWNQVFRVSTRLLPVKTWPTPINIRLQPLMLGLCRSFWSF